MNKFYLVFTQSPEIDQKGHPLSLFEILSRSVEVNGINVKKIHKVHDITFDGILEIEILPELLDMAIAQRKEFSDMVVKWWEDSVENGILVKHQEEFPINALLINADDKYRVEGAIFITHMSIHTCGTTLKTSGKLIFEYSKSIESSIVLEKAAQWLKEKSKLDELMSGAPLWKSNDDKPSETSEDDVNLGITSFGAANSEGYEWMMGIPLMFRKALIEMMVTALSRKITCDEADGGSMREHRARIEGYLSGMWLAGIIDTEICITNGYDTDFNNDKCRTLYFKRVSLHEDSNRLIPFGLTLQFKLTSQCEVEENPYCIK
jgi:hypothetical protein